MMSAQGPTPALTIEETTVSATPEDDRSTKRTVEAMAQSAFERDRLIAWYAAELHNARDMQGRDRAALEAKRREVDELHALAGNLSAQLDAVLASTSWRVTLPLRAARRPRHYLARLMAR